MDGILIGIKAPSLRDVPNPRDYWSGHYHRYGLNVLAMCNHAYRFTWIGVNGPGGMSDNTNYALSSLADIVESLPTGTHINSDNAFDATEHNVTPFSGSQKDLQWNDVYNFFHSQVRIKIEQTCGIFNYSRFPLFQGQLRMSFKKVPMLIITAAMIHNVILDYTLPEDVPLPSASQVIAAFGSDLVRASPSTPDDIERTVLSTPGSSIIRQIMVDYVRSRNLSRPAHNARRNAR